MDAIVMSGFVIKGKTETEFYIKTKDSFVEMVEDEFKGRIRVGDRITSSRIESTTTDSTENETRLQYSIDEKSECGVFGQSWGEFHDRVNKLEHPLLFLKRNRRAV